MKSIEKNERNAFSSAPENIKRIAFEKPAKWEYLLTIELLKEGIEEASKEYWEVRNNFRLKSLNELSEAQATKYFRKKVDSLVIMPVNFSHYFNNILPVAWGAMGAPGDAVKIKFAVNNITQFVRQLTVWEKDLTRSNVPVRFEPLKLSFSGGTEMFLSSVEEYIQKLEKITKEAVTGGNYSLSLEIDYPEGYGDKVYAEYEKLTAFYHSK